MISATAAPLHLPWPLTSTTQPPPPHSTLVNVATYGAVADNSTDNSVAFRKAFAALASGGGGTILFGGEGIYRTGPLNVTTRRTRMIVQNGTTIMALCDRSAPWPRAAPLPSYNNDSIAAPLIHVKADDVELTGGGTIDGDGRCFWKKQSTTVTEKTISRVIGTGFGSRPHLFLSRSAARLTIDGIYFQNSAFWTTHLYNSSNVWIKNLTIYNPASTDNAALYYGPNTDGIDIDSTSRALIENSTIHAGDDCIVVKSGEDAAGRAFATPSANILARDLVLDSCSCFKDSHGGAHSTKAKRWYDGCGGVKIGTEMSGGVANVTFERLTIRYAGTAVKLLAPTPRGSFVRNVTWRDIEVEEASGLLELQIGNSSAIAAENSRVSDVVFQNIHLANLSCRFDAKRHRQTQCTTVGYIDFDFHEPRVALRMENVTAISSSGGGTGGWRCTGPPARLSGDGGIVPALPASCASRSATAAGSVNSDDPGSRY